MEGSLTAFLRRRGLARPDLLAVLTGPSYEVTSLYDLQSLARQPELLTELAADPQLKDKKVTQSALARLTAEAVDNAVYFQEHPGADAAAETMAAFLTDAGVLEHQQDKDTLVWVLRNGGIESLEKIRTAKTTPSRAAAIRAKLAQHTPWPSGEGAGTAMAERFDTLVTAAAVSRALNPELPEVSQELQTFLAQRGLPTGTVPVMAECGITTLAQFKRFKEADDDDPGLSTLRAKLDETGVPNLRQQVEEITPEQVQEEIAQVKSAPTDPDDEQAQQRKKQLKETIAEVKELRQSVERSAASGAATVSAAVEEQLQSVLATIGDVSGQDFGDARTRAAASAQDLSQLLGNTVEQATSFHNMLDGVDTTPRTTAAILRAQDMLCGFLVSPAGAEAMTAPLVRFPDEVEDMVRDPGPIRSQTTIARGSSTSAAAMSLARMSSATTSVAWEVSGSAFVGSGMASVSSAGSYARADAESSESTGFGAKSADTWHEVRFSYVPTQVLQFDTDGLRLGSSARMFLEAVAGEPRDARRGRLVAFFEKYGSHFFRRSDVGGRYEFTSTGKATTTAAKEKLVGAVAKATDIAASVSATYSGIGGSVETGGSAQHDERSAAASGFRMEREIDGSDVSVAITVLGGGGIAPQNAWTESLRYNSTWRVIDRSQPIGVWDLVSGDAGLPAKVRALAELMEEVWVREIFLRGAKMVNSALHDALA